MAKAIFVVWVLQVLLILASVHAASPPPPPSRSPPPPPPTTPKVTIYNTCSLTDCCTASKCTCFNNNLTYTTDDQCGTTASGAKILPPDCPGLPNQGCQCSSSLWKVGKWKVKYPIASTPGPYQVTTTSITSYTTPFMQQSTVDRATCCKTCTNLNNGTKNATTGKPDLKCAYWQHIVVPTSPGNTASTCAASSSCGYCIIYPPGYAPECETAKCTVQGSMNFGVAGNYSTVGQGCAGGGKDPHFMGADGTMFDFNGFPDESFCLITDPALQVNMKMRGYYDTRTVGASILRNGLAVRTWMKEMGFLWMDPVTGARHALRLVARDGKSTSRDDGYMGFIEMDGVRLPRMSPDDRLSLDGGLTVAFLGYDTEGGGFFDVDVYEVNIPNLLTAEIKLRVAHPLLQTASDAMAHLNIKFLFLSHGESTHGVLGQTFRPGREKRALDYSALSALIGRNVPADSDLGSGYLDGTAADYRTTDVLSSDCKYSAFNGQQVAF